MDSTLTPASIDSTIKSKALIGVISGIRELISLPTSVSVTRN